MNDQFYAIILQCTGASGIYDEEIIQELWSGYGKIKRLYLKNASSPSIIVKHIQLNDKSTHPRGWNSDIGHQRKIKSYQVEGHFYKEFSRHSLARLPRCLAIDHFEDQALLVLEDLDVAGFPIRKSRLSWQEIESCLNWLAKFHASYLGKSFKGLWEVGTYWHLATRPAELEALQDLNLKKAASAIDEKLNSCRFKTLVHGDAKLANFCFSKDGEVAGVDFQYVGGGCGMKDVAYFIGSCLNEDDCEKLEDQILDTYFHLLQKALGYDIQDLEIEWRPMYRVAWADFHRFLKGWSPGHWKINSYSERVTTEVIGRIVES